MKRYKGIYISYIVFIWMVLFSLIGADEESHSIILLPTDHIGHHQVHFSPLFPLNQPDLILNGIKVNGSIPYANGSFKIDMINFPISLDTNDLELGNSWFNYFQGDYLYKKIIIGRKFINQNKSKFIFQGSGHTFSGPYGNLEPYDVYMSGSKNTTSLQNYSLQYMYNDSNKTATEIGFLYHLEESGLPLSFDVHHPQKHTSYHAGINWKKKVSSLTYSADIKYQYGKLINNLSNLEYLTIWKDFLISYNVSNSIISGFHYQDKITNREYADSTFLVENGWNNLITYSTINWNKTKSTFGINIIESNFYPDILLKYFSDNFTIIGKHSTEKKYLSAYNDYYPINKTQLKLKLYNKIINPDKSISLLGEINKTQNNIYYSTGSQLFYKKGYSDMNINGYIFYNNNEININILNGSLKFMPVIETELLQFLEDFPLLGMIFWKKGNRYFPFIKFDFWYYFDSNYELPIFEIWKDSSVFQRFNETQIWTNLQFGFTANNFCFTWTINNISNNFVQISNLTQPLGLFTYFKVDWKFSD